MWGLEAFKSSLDKKKRHAINPQHEYQKSAKPTLLRCAEPGPMQDLGYAFWFPWWLQKRESLVFPAV